MASPLLWQRVIYLIILKCLANSFTRKMFQAAAGEVAAAAEAAATPAALEAAFGKEIGRGSAGGVGCDVSHKCY